MDGEDQRARSSCATNYVTSEVRSHMLLPLHSAHELHAEDMHERCSTSPVKPLERAVRASDTIAVGTVLDPLIVDVLNHLGEVEAALRAHMRMAMLSGHICTWLDKCVRKGQARRAVHRDMRGREGSCSTQDSRSDHPQDSP